MLRGHGDCISPSLKHTSQGFLRWFLVLTCMILALKTVAKFLENQKTDEKKERNCVQEQPTWEQN